MSGVEAVTKGYISEADLRERLGLSRVEMKGLRAEMPSGEGREIIQSGFGQGKKPKSLLPWMWNDAAVKWLEQKLQLNPCEKQDAVLGPKVIDVVVNRCNFPNKRIFEGRYDGKYVIMVQCKDSTKLRPKMKVKAKFSNGRAFLISDKSGRAK